MAEIGPNSVSIVILVLFVIAINIWITAEEVDTREFELQFHTNLELIVGKSGEEDAIEDMISTRIVRIYGINVGRHTFKVGDQPRISFEWLGL